MKFDDPRWIAPPAVERIDRADGAFVLRSPEPLGPYARCVGEWLERWARDTPDAPAFAERVVDGWRTLDWRALRHAVGGVAQGILDLGLSNARPIVIVSDNALDHLVLALAAMHVGLPSCAVSSGYSRPGAHRFERLHAILGTLDPSLVYASDAAVYGPALAGAPIEARSVFSTGADLVPGALSFGELRATGEGAEVMRRFEAVTPDTHAKYLLTSGSTGRPKVVVNTQRMLCANQQMLAQAWRFLSIEKPVLLDWLPWSHTFGGNHNTGIVLKAGGTMFIDDGRPLPHAIGATLRNLGEVRPTVYFNVPRGYDMLLPHLEADVELARRFFSRLRMLFYAGASMSQSSWQRIERLAAAVRDEPVWMTTSWGATETAPAVTTPHYRTDRAGVIGLPLPGVDLKFVPGGAKLEMRVRGDSVFPGYRGAPDATRDAFDDEGFYRIGDAGRLVDDARPDLGVVFDGRIAEDFKLTTGTWVSVGTLRVKAITALAPHAQDVVVTGHDQDEVGLLVFPSVEGRALSAEAMARHVASCLRRLADEQAGSAGTPARAMVVDEPPDAEAGEITDKGYINQRAVLVRRAGRVSRLHASGPGDPEVVFPA